MPKYITLFLDFIRILLLLCKPHGTKALIAENLMLRQQLIIIKRKYKRAPNLSSLDRLLFAIYSWLVVPTRLLKTAVLIKPNTIIKFHQALIKRKYQLLFTPKSHSRKPGPKGPSPELIKLIIEMKQKNPLFGCPHIAMQIQNAFGIDIDKDVVRRVLAKHYHPERNDQGPSWLSFLGNMKDSLWSVDLFRCESLLLKSHWVMVMMDQFTRQIIGFAVHPGDLNGIAICCMFNTIIARKQLPKYLSSDNDPLFQFHRWKANLRILEVEEIKTVPHIPISHPFVERLIGSIRQELLDRTFFWNALDLQRKLDHYKFYFNEKRSHKSLDALTPTEKSDQSHSEDISLSQYRWNSFCNNLFHLPIAA